MKPALTEAQLQKLVKQIRQWGTMLGFQQIGITDIDLSQHEPLLQSWLAHNYHGEMAWMARHGMMRARPNELMPETIRVISARMDYLPEDAKFAQTLNDPALGYISRYALGRDYHKLIRQRLKKLGEYIEQEVGQYHYRPFVDSAPILERPLAQKSGLGWTGKHSLILNKQAGSWFFLGELLVDLPLPIDQPSQDQCGKCIACITTCPTQAIIQNKVLDARRCISYLTIEFDGIIPEEFRKAIGNRIYGCDDCQLACPFNRFAQISQEKDFQIRNILDQRSLKELFRWSEEEFLKHTEGSAIRRIGHEKWQRNIIIAFGNAEYDPEIVNLLVENQKRSTLLDPHIEWALNEQLAQKSALKIQISSNQTKRLIRSIQKGLPRDA